jgi:TetR/AcrR family transcriptional regulator, cholesterol catabolism regulator
MDASAFPQGPRAKQKSETRDRVLAAARKLFEARGYSEVTVRMIADDAGIAVGSVFTSFESKDDLLIEIVCEDFARLAPILTQRLGADRGRSLADRIAYAYKPAAAYDITHLSKFREVMANGWVRTDDQEARFQAVIAPLETMLTNEIKAAQIAGEISAGRDPALLTDMICKLYFANFRDAAYRGWDLDQVHRHFRAQLKTLLQ